MRARLIAVVAAGLAMATALALAPSEPAAPPAAGAQATPPNVIVLLTDDQETYSMRVMKTVRKELKRKGTTMKRFYDNFPLCCPARTTIFTGQYAHNHHVLSNVPPDGGYGVFNELHGNNYLPLWLQAAGYRTSYIGKFENGYAEPDEYGTTPSDVPFGWDDWHVLAPSRAQYFNYRLNNNGTLRQYSEREEDYSTYVFTNKARRFVRQNAKVDIPFYLELGYAAPHGGGGGDPGRSCNRAAVPAAEDLGALKTTNKGVLPPSFNEADVTDKPSVVAQRDPLTPGQIRDTLRKRRCAWESLLAVDRSVGEIIDEIKRDGIRENTYIFFLSDNGFLRGEHRIRDNKRYLYEESARVPFIARGPGINRGGKSNDVAVNADLTATVLHLTGATPGLTQDGQSLLPSLQNPNLELGRAILLEAYGGPPIKGVRTSRYLYTEWDTGGLPERELYDTDADPYQLTNLANDPAYLPVVAQLGQEVRQLEGCAGASCRTAPSGSLTVAGVSSRKGGACAVPPVTARISTSDDADVVAASFRVGRVQLPDDTEPPFEVVLPDAAIRDELPKPARVIGRALFEDGRRLGYAANVRLCK
jgi:N-acetylglucosamine-6-sulfatase